MKAWFVVCVLMIAAFSASAQQQSKAQAGIAGVLESKVRKAWEDYTFANGTATETDIQDQEQD
jgi:hypothetical protein